MKKTLLIAALGLLSFTTQEPKTVTLTLTPDEVNLIYMGLGELPDDTELDDIYSRPSRHLCSSLD